MGRPEPNNGEFSEERHVVHDEMLAKFHAHGFQGPCAECGMVPWSSLSVAEWVEHHMADEIVRLRQSSKR